MPLSKRTALGISLGVIVLYWIYQIVAHRTGTSMPADFSQFVVRVVTTKLVVLTALLVLLRLDGGGLRDLGVTGHEWPKHLGLGLLFGFGMFVLFNVALDSVMSSVIPRPSSSGRSVTQFFESPLNLLAWIPIGIFGGGVVEELQRIFVITRFEAWLGRPGLILGVALTSVMFGYGHLYQGVGTAIGTALSGVMFSLIYLRRRSALEPIAAHAFSDVLAVLGATMLARH